MTFWPEGGATGKCPKWKQFVLWGAWLLYSKFDDKLLIRFWPDIGARDLENSQLISRKSSHLFLRYIVMEEILMVALEEIQEVT